MIFRFPHTVFVGLALVTSCFPDISFGCIWIHGTTMDGTPKEHSPHFPSEWILYSIERNPADRLSEVSKAKPANSREEKENRAVALSLAAKPREAIHILQEMEKESPGEYTVAANIGTAYELAGDPENALVWIREGITRNPSSHSGTEWLHALILETKIRLQKDPGYLTTHRIIPLPEKFSADTMLAISGTQYAVGQVELGLYYQLRERCVFVKPPDPVVADLLFSLARIAAQTGVVEEGLSFLEASQKYGFADPQLLEKTRAEFEASKRIGDVRRAENQQRAHDRKILALVITSVLLIAGLVVCYRKGWLFLTPGARRRHLEKKRKASLPANPGGNPHAKAEEPAPKT